MSQPRKEAPHTILWRRVDQPGHDSARVAWVNEHWTLAGSSVFSHEGSPCRLDYRVLCDEAWHTVYAVVDGWVGDRVVEVEIEVDERGRWRLNGERAPEVSGCIDVDLNFSPSTNLLPIRRLALDVGDEAEVAAAWLRFPTFALEPLAQRYRRTGDRAYHYESGGGAFVRDLTVDAAGFAIRYPDFFEIEGSPDG